MRQSSNVVLDASAIVPALLTPDGAARLETAMAGAMALAPEVVDVEVLSALRKAVARGETTDEHAQIAIEHHSEFPLERVPHRAFLAAAWSLRHNLTAADALYVAVARAFGAQLVTSDRRLAGAPGLGVAVTVLPS